MKRIIFCIFILFLMSDIKISYGYRRKEFLGKTGYDWNTWLERDKIIYIVGFWEGVSLGGYEGRIFLSAFRDIIEKKRNRKF